MKNGFIELHDSDNRLLFINSQNIALIRKLDNGKVWISFNVPKENFMVTVEVKEGYETIKQMLLQ